MSKYQCKECGCGEFVTEVFHQYHIYEADGDTLSYQDTTLSDDGYEYKKFRLFCRECGCELDFDIKDVERV